ncbi:6-hydroxymethylpterin diphosphokinase MptE-like protein [Thalassotalea sp. SU-HH00458]|uniref:motility associated factor glycosyltransferase family protein n=1 Tax=Thalassotalea sp. SU-HH00458 TaxID=3127657 RepID=UPI003102E71B
MSFSDDYNELLNSAEKNLEKLKKKHQLEQELVEKMQSKFDKNIIAFQKYYPDIAEKFKQDAPQNLPFFCAPSGDANILFGPDSAPLYSEDPVSQCKTQIDIEIANPKFSSLSFTLEDKENREDNFIHSKYLNQIHDVYLENKEKLEPLKQMPDHIGSMIVFGIGLGYHLDYLIEKITIGHLYLCEPSYELFYASLYTCDWSMILKTLDERNGYLHLHIGVSYEQFTTDYINEIKDKGSFNSVNAVLIQHYPSKELRQIIDRFCEEFHLVAIGWGFFDDGVISIAHDYANAKNNIPVLKRDVVLPKKWQNTPAFVVANGPSLDATIETIKAYEKDAIIFSCGSVLPSLIAHNIIPDFHIELERTKLTFDYLNDLIDHEHMKQLNFLTLNIMHPDCPQLFKWTGIGFKPTESSTIIACDFINKNKDFVQMKFSNPAVANTGMSFACYMGFKDIYLFGVDNGYKDRKHHHSKKSLYYTDDGKEKEAIGDIVRAGEIEVEGNFGEPILSTVFFNTSNFYEGKLLENFPQVNCYNCSDGAKIENTYPLRVDDILLAKSNADKSELVEYLKANVFIDREFSEEIYKNCIAVNMFDEICDNLVSYLDKEFDSRAEVLEQLMQQVRYLHSFAYTPYRHIFFMLEGSLTYIQTMFRLMLFDFADEKATLQCVHQSIEIFKTYMHEAKIKYANVLDEVDSHNYNVISMFKEKDTAE